MFAAYTSIPTFAASSTPNAKVSKADVEKDRQEILRLVKGQKWQMFAKKLGENTTLTTLSMGLTILAFRALSYVWIRSKTLKEGHVCYMLQKLVKENPGLKWDY